MTKKVWLTSYPKHIPHELDENSLLPLNTLIENAYEKFSSSPAFSCLGKTLSFADTKKLSNQLACFFKEDLHLKKDDKIALMMPNVLQYPVALHAALRSGLVVVNVNPLYTARELEHQLNDSGATTIIILENFAHVLSQVIQKTKVKHVILTSLGDLLGFPKKTLINFVIKYVKKMVLPYDLPQAIQFNHALKQGEDKSFTPIKLSTDDIAFLQYTGGTTGVSKGAVLTHKNISANIAQATLWLKDHIKESHETIITPLPLYHIFSLTANCFIFMNIGGHNILIPNPKDIPAFIKVLKKYSFTAITGVNTLFNALLNHPEFANLDFSKLKITLGGGTAVQQAVADKWQEVTKTPLIEAYGLTETSPAVCVNPLSIKAFNGTIGLPLPSTSVSIRDDNDQEVELNETGELCIKGPQVMHSYWQNEKETSKVFNKDGWLKTGDIALMTNDGYVKIVDRKKDMINVSGFNVYPNEIEDVVSSHPDVLECAAIGVPSEKSGECVKIFVVKKDKHLTVHSLLTHCKEHLTGYKIPKQIEFRDELPKTNVGKILRRKLRD